MGARAKLVADDAHGEDWPGGWGQGRPHGSWEEVDGLQMGPFAVGRVPLQRGPWRCGAIIKNKQQISSHYETELMLKY